MENSSCSYDVDIKVCEARNVDKSYLAVLCVIFIKNSNNTADRLVGCTFTKWKTINPQWDENFRVQLRESEDIKIEVWVLTKKQKSKLIKIGEFNDFLLINTEHSKADWFNNNYVADKKIDKKQKGKKLQLRVTCKYEQIMVLPPNYYQEISKHLVAKSYIMVRSMIQNTTTILPSTKASFARSVCHFFIGENKSEEVLKILSFDEIAETASEKELFAVNSMSTKIIDTYVSMTGPNWVQQTLSPTLLSLTKKITSSKFIPVTSQLETSMPILTSLFLEILESLFSSVNPCPTAIRRLFTFLLVESNLKFPPKDKAKVSSGLLVISGIVARLFTPAIEMPKSHGIIQHDTLLDEPVEKTFALLSKILKRFSSFSHFGNTEKSLQPLNNIFDENYTKLTEFLSKLSEETTEPWEELFAHVDYNGALARILKHVAKEMDVVKATNDNIAKTEQSKGNDKGKELDVPDKANELDKSGELFGQFMMAFEKLTKEAEESMEKQSTLRIRRSNEETGPVSLGKKSTSFRQIRKGISQKGMRMTTTTTTTTTTSTDQSRVSHLAKSSTPPVSKPKYSRTCSSSDLSLANSAIMTLNVEPSNENGDDMKKDRANSPPHIAESTEQIN